MTHSHRKQWTYHDQCVAEIIQNYTTRPEADQPSRAYCITWQSRKTREGCYWRHQQQRPLAREDELYQQELFSAKSLSHNKIINEPGKKTSIYIYVLKYSLPLTNTFAMIAIVYNHILYAIAS